TARREPQQEEGQCRQEEERRNRAGEAAERVGQHRSAPSGVGNGDPARGGGEPRGRLRAPSGVAEQGGVGADERVEGREARGKLSKVAVVDEDAVLLGEVLE